MNSTLIFIETMASNPLVIVSAYLLSLLSVILAIILYIKSKKMKIPCYATNTINIFRDYNSNIESLEILYGGKLINNLSITKLAFWNAGKETIKKADLPSVEKLHIFIKPGLNIFNAKIIQSNNHANNFNIKLDDNKSNICIDFDFLDRYDGVVMQIIHSGTSDDDIKMAGILIGSKKVSKKYIVAIEIKKKIDMKLMILLSLSTYSLSLFIKEGIFSAGWFLSGVIAGTGIVMVFYYVLTRRLPKGFDKLETQNWY